MKRMNERVEKRMEELGLNKNDMRSIDIAMESLKAEAYAGFNRNEVSHNNSEGLWLGGMDRGRKRDISTSFGTNSPNNKGKKALSFDLNAPEYIEIDSEEDSDDVYVVGESSSRQHTWGTLGGDDMDVDGGSSSRQCAQEEIRNGQVSNQRPWLQENHSNTLELLADTLAAAEFIGDDEFQELNPMPIRPQPFRPPLAELAVRDNYHRRQMKEAAQHFAQSIHYAENSGSQELVNEAGKLGSSGGPFWEALEEVRARTSKKAAEDLIKWIPSVQIQDRTGASLFVPSLVELSLKVLTENANSITSLDLVPYFLRKKLTDRLCDTRTITADFFNLLLEGCPTELRLKNCSWLTDDQFQQSLGSWQTENLRVLQLDVSGQIMFEYAIRNKLAQSRNSFSKLAILSLRGALRLTDPVIKLLGSSAPALLSINLGHCSLLTFKAVEYIADYFGENLRELYIDSCYSINALLIEHCISKFEKLEVFSVAGLEGVSDGFISELVSACGKTLLELDLADCIDLTDDSLSAIATNCPGLLALNISKLLKLTNVGMEFLANKCRSIQRLNLTGTKFSDEVIAAFLETSGESLTELSLNSVSRVGPNTALSLARKSKNLAYLDISFCCGISNNALGLIVDSCLSLKLLKVFGCRQINTVFLNGHSNPLVRIVGFGLMPILEHINLLEPDEMFLRYTKLPDPIDSQYEIVQQREGRT